MNILSDEHKLILSYLKTSKSFTLNQLTKITRLNKSTLLYKLEELVEVGFVNKTKLSPRKIYYKVASEKQRKEKIKDIIEEIESVVIESKVEGLEEYKRLLDMIAEGESEIYGYGNIEHKIIPEVEPLLEEFRDKIARAKRKDRFVVPDSLRNIELLKDHFRKPEWEKVFEGRIIERSKMYVNADIYCWDNTVGICSFGNNEFKIQIYTDEIFVETMRCLLRNLWENAIKQ